MLSELGIALCTILAIRTISAVHGLVQSMRTLPCQPEMEKTKHVVPAILLVVPVLRETRIIAATLDQLITLDYPRDRLFIVVAAVKEDVKSGSRTTAQVVRDWIEQFGHKHVSVMEYSGGKTERAIQVNHATAWALANFAPDAQIIGFYDADSRPDPATLRWVAYYHTKGFRCQQQPLHYMESALELSRHGASGLCVANAIYQSAWSLTKEWPNLLRYRRQWSNGGGPYRYSLYLNGHGQFLSRSLFEEISGVPEGVVTDGIQLGYRLSLLGEPIAPIPVFCSDDVPSSVPALMKQHQRWFAGNIRFGDARAWVHSRGIKAPITAVIENVILNASWAMKLPFTGVAALLVAFSMEETLQQVMAGVLLSTIVIYSYLLPALARRVSKVPGRLRLRDWLMLPLAVGFKSVGPLIYLVHALFVGRMEANKYLIKVER